MARERARKRLGRAMAAKVTMSPDGMRRAIKRGITWIRDLVWTLSTARVSGDGIIERNDPNEFMLFMLACRRAYERITAPLRTRKP